MHPLYFHATPYAVLSCEERPSRLFSRVVKEIMPGELIWNSVCKHLFSPDELPNGTGQQPACLLGKAKRARVGLLLHDFILGEEPNLLHSIFPHLPLCTLFNVYCWTYCFLLKLYLLPPSVMLWLCPPAAAWDFCVPLAANHSRVQSHGHEARLPWVCLWAAPFTWNTFEPQNADFGSGQASQRAHWAACWAAATCAYPAPRLTAAFPVPSAARAAAAPGFFAAISLYFTIFRPLSGARRCALRPAERGSGQEGAGAASPLPRPGAPNGRLAQGLHRLLFFFLLLIFILLLLVLVSRRHGPRVQVRAAGEQRGRGRAGLSGAPWG